MRSKDRMKGAIDEYRQMVTPAMFYGRGMEYS